MSRDVSELEYGLNVVGLLDHWGYDTSSLHDLRERDWRTCCILHDGDNIKGAALTYRNGRYWYKCFTHKCASMSLVDLGMRGGRTFVDVIHDYEQFQGQSAPNKPRRYTTKQCDVSEPLSPHVMDQFIPSVHSDLTKLGFDRDILRNVFDVRFCNDDQHELYQYIVYPIRDKLGRIASVQGRVVTRHEHEWQKYRFLDGRSGKCTLYGTYEQRARIANSRYIIVAESPKSCWRGYQLGFPTVATMGVQYTQEQVRQLVLFGKRVIIVADNDEAKFINGQWHRAGIEGAQKLANELRRYIPVDVVIVPDVGRDISDYVDRQQWIDILRGVI